MLLPWLSFMCSRQWCSPPFTKLCMAGAFANTAKAPDGVAILGAVPGVPVPDVLAWVVLLTQSLLTS